MGQDGVLLYTFPVYLVLLRRLSLRRSNPEGPRYFIIELFDCISIFYFKEDVFLRKRIKRNKYFKQAKFTVNGS